MRPQRESLKKLWVVLGMAVAFMSMDICFTYSQEVKTQEAARPVVAHENARKPLATKIIPPSADMYAVDPKPLSNVECGQCHTKIYINLKTDGGRHKFQCQECHRVLHAYSPVKKNWQELMPRCNDCHILPHGEKFPDCSSCHGDPHAATKITETEILTNSCVICHGKQFDELQKFPSAHTKLSCRDCHTTHGFLPNCNACHKSHYEGEDFATCATECHPVHMPLEINYKKDANARICWACHGKIHAVWQKSPSNHAHVNCADCHSKHGYIPACSECHAMPHSKQLLERFPNCLTCHLDPHDPPVKQHKL
ncbi:MAG: hypothetical protein WC156_07880 [Pedobacter sp.]